MVKIFWLSTHHTVWLVFILLCSKTFIQKNYRLGTTTYPLSTIIWVVFFNPRNKENKTKHKDFLNHSLGLKMNAFGSVSTIQHFRWTAENYP